MAQQNNVGPAVGVSMGTQTSVNAETQTSPGLLTPGVLRRGNDATPSGNRVSISEEINGSSRGNQAAASLNGQLFLLEETTWRFCGNQAAASLNGNQADASLNGQPFSLEEVA